MHNLLSDYRHIITTYLTGLKTYHLNDFQFDINAEEGSVSFTKYLQEGNKLELKYTLDKQDLEKEDPSAEFLKIVLHTLRSEIKELLNAGRMADAV